MSHRETLGQAIQAYTSPYREEDKFKSRFGMLLTHPRAFFRDHLPGHITASSWIIDQRREFCLLTHHTKLRRWLQPGGHADGEEDVMAVAQREAWEETGLRSLKILGAGIFDLDIHRIPAHNGFPEHLHYDIRFLFQASMAEAVVASKESTALAWVPLQNIAAETGNNVSILRMAEKVRALS